MRCDIPGISTLAPHGTTPEPLFHDDPQLNDKALDILLAATYGNVPTNRNAPLHRLPSELKNLILDHASEAPVETARIGAVLEIGPEFSWKCKGREMERTEVVRDRTPDMPPESWVQFDDRQGWAGIAYT